GIASASGPLLEVTTCLLADNEFLIFVRPGSPFSKFDGVVSITASASAEDMICWMLVLPSTVAGYFWTVPYFSFTFKTLSRFRPLPIVTHTTRSDRSILPASRFFLRPAIDAALAGSTNIPSFEARFLWASRISLSETVSAVPWDSLIAWSTFIQLTGDPILMAEAIVRGLVTGSILSCFRLTA